MKNTGYEKINSENPLYLYLIGYIKESHENTYLMLVPTIESRDTQKMSQKTWNRIRNFIRSLISN